MSAEDCDLEVSLEELYTPTLNYKVMMGNIADPKNSRKEIHSADCLKDLDVLFFTQVQSRLYSVRENCEYTKLKLTIMANSLSGEEEIILRFIKAVRLGLKSVHKLVFGKTEDVTIKKSYLENLLKSGSKKVCFVDYVHLDLDGSSSLKSAFDVVKCKNSSLEYLTMHVDAMFHSTLMNFMGVTVNNDGTFSIAEGVQIYHESKKTKFYTVNEKRESVEHEANLMWISLGNLLLKIPSKKSDRKFFYFDLTRITQGSGNR